MAETWQKWSLSMGAVSQPDIRIRRDNRWQKQQKKISMIPAKVQMTGM